MKLNASRRHSNSRNSRSREENDQVKYEAREKVSIATEKII